MTSPLPDIVEVARSWSYWDRPVPMTVARDVDLPDELRDSLCLVIQGVRRCGKSTLLQQLIGRYDLDPATCAFINFEDPRLSNALHYDLLQALVDGFRAARPGAERLAFFLDEIQWVDGWERWLRTQLERPNGHLFVVTGSNAQLLSGELGSALTGRHLTVELFPFDLAERRRQAPDTTLNEYLHDGGFPEPLAMSDGDRLRRQYFHDIVERDVRERLRARSAAPIRQVVQMAFESAGAEMSLRRVAAATGIAVDTASSYLDACEAAYIVLSCPFFAYSERKRSVRNRKYYPIDTGLRRIAVTRTGRDQGKALECAAFVALRRRFGEVFYWRDKGEVDFVVRDGDAVIPVQVTWDGPTERHHRALDAFFERFPFAAEPQFITAASLDERGLW